MVNLKKKKLSNMYKNPCPCFCKPYIDTAVINKSKSKLFFT